MPSPLVSIIMPTRNRWPFLREAINCFFRQTYQNSELIIVDNSDGKIPGKLPADPRLRYSRLAVNGLSTGAMRNACCELSRGELIAHMDDDDWYADNHIEGLVRLQQSCGLDMVGYRTCWFWDQKNSQMYRYDGAKDYIVGASMLYTKQLWRIHRFPDLVVGEDNALLYSAKNRAGVTGDGLLIARVHGKNTWNKVIRPGSRWEPINVALPPGFVEVKVS